MKNFLFLNNENGELFFVECKTLAGAWIIVWENFEEDADIEYISECSAEEADILGYDTY
jgi:hypothetical protein